MIKRLELAEGWPQPERAFLEKFYAEHNAISWEERFTALVKHLDGAGNFSSFPPSEVTIQQKVGCLEYELLMNNGLCTDCLC